MNIQNYNINKLSTQPQYNINPYENQNYPQMPVSYVPLGSQQFMPFMGA